MSTKKPRTKDQKAKKPDGGFLYHPDASAIQDTLRQEEAEREHQRRLWAAAGMGGRCY